MPQTPPQPASTDDLQFDTLEPATPQAAVAPVCVGCHRPIESTYYALRDKVVCPSCRAQVLAPPKGSGFVRFTKATIMGIGAGLVGAAIWYAVCRISGYQLGIVAILVGFFVGKAVRKGSAGRGGVGYQLLAVLLTYCCIAANYAPIVFNEISKKIASENTTTIQATPNQSNVNIYPSATTSSATPGLTQPGHHKLPVAFWIVFGVVMWFIMPIFLGVKNPILLLILGIALWQAWKLTARRKLLLTGPYEIGLMAPGAQVTP